jgi:hypothetical protein
MDEIDTTKRARTEAEEQPQPCCEVKEIITSGDVVAVVADGELKPVAATEPAVNGVKNVMTVKEVVTKDGAKSESEVVVATEQDRDDGTPDLLGAEKKADTQESVASTVVVATPEDGSSVKPADASQPTVDSQEATPQTPGGVKTEGEEEELK